MKTIAVINQKGGVAKTTTSHNLAVGLALQGHRVLAVDLDPQANLTLLLGVDSADVEVEGTVATLFRDGARIQNILVDTVEAGVTLLPASIELAAAVENLYSVLRRETKLKKALSFVEERFDYVVMDCGPNLGVLSVNAIVAADGILVPAQLSRLSLRGLHDLLMTVAEVREGEPGLRPARCPDAGQGRSKAASRGGLATPGAGEGADSGNPDSGVRGRGKKPDGGKRDPGRGEGSPVVEPGRPGLSSVGEGDTDDMADEQLRNNLGKLSRGERVGKPLGLLKQPESILTTLPTHQIAPDPTNPAKTWATCRSSRRPSSRWASSSQFWLPRWRRTATRYWPVSGATRRLESSGSRWSRPSVRSVEEQRRLEIQIIETSYIAP
jgi:cellulose biosynthesis protein BcsQ